MAIYLELFWVPGAVVKLNILDMFKGACFGVAPLFCGGRVGVDDS